MVGLKRMYLWKLLNKRCQEVSKDGLKSRACSNEGVKMIELRRTSLHMNLCSRLVFPFINKDFVTIETIVKKFQIRIVPKISNQYTTFQS